MTEDQGESKSSRWIGAVAVLVVTVLGLWWWSGRPDGSQRDAAAEQGEGPTTRGRRGAAGDVTGRDPLASATGLFRGRVMDFDGQPVADAEVCARARRGRRDSPRPACTLTDGEGRYQLPELRAGDYDVFVSAAEHQPQDQRRALVSGAEVELDFELLAGAVEVSGVVYDLAGGTVEGAVVTIGGDRFSGDPSGRALGLTDGEGRFSAWVRRGRLHVYAGAEGYATRNIYAAAPGPSLALYLVPEVVIRGRVVDAKTGAGLAHVAVEEGEVGSGMPMAFTELGRGATQTDGEGNFVLAGLRPGAYKPYVVSGPFRGVAEQTVNLGLGDTSEPIEIRAQRAGQVEVSLVDEDGQPTCEKGSLAVTPAPFEIYSVELDAEGVAEIGGLRSGDYDATAHCWGRMIKHVGSFTIDAEARALEPLVWTIPRGASLAGRVVDDGGRALARVVVVATLIPNQDDARGRTARKARAEPSDKAGAFSLRGLEPGDYTLSLGGTSGPKLREPVEVHVGADGLDGVELETLSGGWIRGRVVDGSGEGVANMTVSAYGDAGGWVDTRSGDEGGFELDGLGPDGYRVVALDGRWQVERGEVRVALEPGADVDATITIGPATGRITGQVVDHAGAPLGDAFIHLERQAEALDAAPPVGRLSYSDARGRPVLTDVDGAFAVEGLPEGLYTVTAIQRQGGEAAVVDVELGERVEVVIPALAELGGIVVLDRKGVEEFAVSLTRVGEQGEFDRRDEWRASGGRWRFERLPPGTYDIRVSAPRGDASAQVELAPGGAVLDMAIELAPRVSIQARVVDASTQAPLAEVEIRVSAPGAAVSGIGHVAWATTDTEGRASLVVPVGELPVRVIPPGRADARVHQGLGETIEVTEEARAWVWALEPK